MRGDNAIDAKRKIKNRPNSGISQMTPIQSVAARGSRLWSKAWTTPAGRPENQNPRPDAARTWKFAQAKPLLANFMNDA